MAFWRANPYPNPQLQPQPQPRPHPQPNPDPNPNQALTRRVFIVHSDLYPPPHYLNFAHPQLTAMPHSAFFPRNASLPNFNRNAIGANIHRIPNLATWYFVLDDDFLLARPFSWSTFIRASTLVARFASIKRLRDIGATSLRDGYFGAMGNSARLLARQFGTRARGADLHFPYFIWRPAIEEMARGWPQVFELTSASRFGSVEDVQMYVLYGHYMVDTGRSRELSGWWDGLRGRGTTWDAALAELHTTDECRCDGHTQDLSSDALARVNPNPNPNPSPDPSPNPSPDPNPNPSPKPIVLTRTLTLGELVAGCGGPRAKGRVDQLTGAGLRRCLPVQAKGPRAQPSIARGGAPVVREHVSCAESLRKCGLTKVV